MTRLARTGGCPPLSSSGSALRSHSPSSSVAGTERSTSPRRPAPGTSTSAVGMVACCAHHLADLVPLLGATGLAAFLFAGAVHARWHRGQTPSPRSSLPGGSTQRAHPWWAAWDSAASSPASQRSERESRRGRHVDIGQGIGEGDAGLHLSGGRLDPEIQAGRIDRCHPRGRGLGLAAEGPGHREDVVEVVVIESLHGIVSGAGHRA